MSCKKCNKPTICGCDGGELNIKCLYYAEEESLENLDIDKNDQGLEIIQKIDAAIGDVLELVNGVVPEAPTCPLTASTTGSADRYIMVYNCTTGTGEWIAARIVTLT